MKTFNEALAEFGKRGGEARFNSLMGGSLLGRGLDLSDIANVLCYIYPEAEELGYDEVWRKLYKLEDEFCEGIFKSRRDSFSDDK